MFDDLCVGPTQLTTVAAVTAVTGCVIAIALLLCIIALVHRHRLLQKTSFAKILAYCFICNHVRNRNRKRFNCQKVFFLKKFLAKLFETVATCIGVDLAGILGDAWRAPKVGRCRVGCGMGRGVPSPAD